jgi:hypothetical protein
MKFHLMSAYTSQKKHVSPILGLQTSILKPKTIILLLSTTVLINTQYIPKKMHRQFPLV